MIRKKIFYLIFILISSVASCQDKTEQEVTFKVKEVTIENLSVDLLIDCKSDLKVSRTINDSHKIYSLKIPKDWNFEETVTDGLNGIIISKDSSSLNLIGIVEIPNDSLSLDQFFQKEFIRAMLDKTGIEIIDAGTAKINGLESYWIFHKSELETEYLWTYLYYAKNNKNNNFYLINTSMFAKGNDSEIQCELRKIVNTFKFIE